MINFITKSKDVNRASYIWNALAGMLNSVQSPVLLLLVARGVKGVEDSAFLVIAYAIGNLMMMIGKYGVRNYHVTDVNQEHSFREYLLARQITVVLMLVSSMIYIMVNGYKGDKMLVVLLICLMKLFDSYEDVYHGQLQKMGRLDIAGKILSIRLIFYFVIFFVVYLVTGELLATCLFSVSLSVALGIVLNVAAWRLLDIEKGNLLVSSVVRILKECFPLFLCTYLIMYVANAPKYTVDRYYELEVQAAFNYVFMPVFVIALLGNFIFQPMQTKASVIYKDRQYKEFYSLIIKGTVAVGVITLVITLLGALVGIPVLSVVFNCDLKGYRTELVLMLIAGGGLALINMLNIFISLIRYQKHMIVAYCVVALFTKLLGDYVGANYTVLSLVIFYCVAVFLLVLSLMIILISGIKKNKGVA